MEHPTVEAPVGVALLRNSMPEKREDDLSPWILWRDQSE